MIEPLKTDSKARNSKKKTIALLEQIIIVDKINELCAEVNRLKNLSQSNDYIIPGKT